MLGYDKFDLADQILEQKSGAYGPDTHTRWQSACKSPVCSAMNRISVVLDEKKKTICHKYYVYIHFEREKLIGCNARGSQSQYLFRLKGASGKKVISMNALVYFPIFPRINYIWARDHGLIFTYGKLSE